MNRMHQEVTVATAAEIQERVVAIVRFGPPTQTSGLRPGEFYQVTVDPRLFSECGRFIRFGNYPGDEITGWQAADAIFVLSILARVPYEHEGDLKIGYFWSRALEEKPE